MSGTAAPAPADKLPSLTGLAVRWLARRLGRCTDWALRWRIIELTALWAVTFMATAATVGAGTTIAWQTANGVWLAAVGWVAFLSDRERARRARMVVHTRWVRACAAARAQTRLTDGQQLPAFTATVPTLRKIVVSHGGNVSAVVNLPLGMTFDAFKAHVAAIAAWHRPQVIDLRVTAAEDVRHAIVEITHWRAFSGHSSDPIPYTPGEGAAVLESGSRWDLPSPGPQTLIVGQTGGGKSSWVNAIIAEALTNPHNPTLWGVDLKRTELAPWRPVFDRLALDADQATQLLYDAERELERRQKALEGKGRKWFPGCGFPPLVLVIDELVQAVWEPWGDEDQKMPGIRRRKVARIASLGRALGMQIVCATQEPIAELVGRIRVNMQTTICCRTRTLTDSEVAVGKGLASDLHPENLTLDGAAWVVPATTKPVLARAKWLDDSDVAQIAAAHERPTSSRRTTAAPQGASRGARAGGAQSATARTTNHHGS